MNVIGMPQTLLAGKTFPSGNTNGTGNLRGVPSSPAFSAAFLNLLQGESAFWSEAVFLDVGTLLGKVEKLLEGLGVAFAEPAAGSSGADPLGWATGTEEGEDGLLETESQFLALLGFAAAGNPIPLLSGQSGQPVKGASSKLTESLRQILLSAQSGEIRLDPAVLRKLAPLAEQTAVALSGQDGSPQRGAVSLLESLRQILLSAQKGEVLLDQAALQKLSALAEQIARMGDANRPVFLSREPSSSRRAGKVPSAPVSPLGTEAVHPGQSGRNPSPVTRLPEGREMSQPPEAFPPSLKKIGFHQLQGMRTVIPETAFAPGTTPAKGQEAQVRAGQFYRQIQDFLVRQIRMTRFPDGVSEARIKLVPENLGAIDIRITVQQGAVTAQFAAETQLGKELLENHLQALRTHLVQQGFHVERLEIAGSSSQGNQPSSQFYAGDDRQQRGREPFFQQQEREGEEPEQQFAELMQSFNQTV